MHESRKKYKYMELLMSGNKSVKVKAKGKDECWEKRGLKRERR